MNNKLKKIGDSLLGFILIGAGVYMIWSTLTLNFIDYTYDEDSIEFTVYPFHPLGFIAIPIGGGIVFTSNKKESIDKKVK